MIVSWVITVSSPIPAHWPDILRLAIMSFLPVWSQYINSVKSGHMLVCRAGRWFETMCHHLSRLLENPLLMQALIPLGCAVEDLARKKLQKSRISIGYYLYNTAT